MKKQTLIVCIVVLMLVALFCGCTENKTNDDTDDGDKGGETTANTYTWTAKETMADIPIDTDFSDGAQVLYNTLKDGDALIIEDIISNINYDPDLDQTTISFEWTEDEMTGSFNPVFEGNLTEIYSAGDNVRITVTIKYVEFTYTDEDLGVSMDYQIEVFEELWTTQEEYISSGGGALPATTIAMIE